MATTKSLKLGPAKLNISGIRAGDSNKIAVQIKKSGSPVDLTAYVVTAQARKEFTQVTQDIDAVVTMVDAVQGKIILAWPGDLVADILGVEDSYDGYWDLQMTDVLDENITVAAGSFEAEWDVTRP